jgi:D-alanyl-D-alanine-carboxypeptidase/D-alanyl-D-alanine-endopeptidase
VDTARQRGVVILSDTTWNSIGSLGSLGMHLVDASVPLGKPRKLATPPQALLDGLAGDYQLQGAMKMRLRHRDGTLYFHPEGQPEYALAYDDAGDFFPTVADAVLRPQEKANGEYTFTWRQGGGVIPATRLAAEGAKPVASPTLSQEELVGYAGVYTLAPGFALTVRAGEGTLHAQATGQGEFPLEAGGKDSFAAPAFGIEIVFKRGADGTVESLDLHQGGRVLSGPRGK